MNLTSPPNTGTRKVPFNCLYDKFFTDGTVTEPVTLQEAKDYCKIDVGTADDTIISYLITTARQQCEDFTGISMITRTVTAVINNSNGGMYLPYGPLKTFISLTDYDGNAIPSTDYKLIGTAFPQLQIPAQDNLTAVYVAGYGASGYAPLPQEIKTAILQQIFYLYENRGDQAIISRTGIVDITLGPQTRATLGRLRRNL